MNNDNNSEPTQEETLSDKDYSDKDMATVEQTDTPIKKVYDEQKNKEITADDITERFLSFLKHDMLEQEEVSKSYAKLDNLKNPEESKWSTAYIMALENLLKGSALSSTVNREDSNWKQKVDNNGEKIGLREFKDKKTGEGKISGARAVAKFKKGTHTGGVIQVPLWHTGIWVTIKSPSENSLIELEKTISTDKVQLGRTTSGMIFSNVSVYTTTEVMNFVLNQVYDATISDISVENLKSVIKVTDLPTLVWGMVCSMYPSGYNYARPCTANPSECTHVVTGLLNLNKLYWSDNSAFSDYQKLIMARRGEKITTEELKRYQEEHKRGGTYTFELKGKDPVTEEDLDVNTNIKFSVPTLLHYETAGYRWIQAVNELTEKSLTATMTEKERNTYAFNQARTITLRQYGHWVKEITMDDEVIDDMETIEVLLNEMCAIDQMETDFFNEIGKYIDDSTISLIAIPKYDCPACGGSQVADIHNNKHPHLLPIDVISTFFTLLDQLIYRVMTQRKL